MNDWKPTIVEIREELSKESPSYERFMEYFFVSTSRWDSNECKFFLDHVVDITGLTKEKIIDFHFRFSISQQLGIGSYDSLFYSYISGKQLVRAEVRGLFYDTYILEKEDGILYKLACDIADEFAYNVEWWLENGLFLESTTGEKIGVKRAPVFFK